MKKVIFYAAVIAWSLSALAHVSSRLGVDVEEAFPYVMALHAGLFLLLIPLIVMLKKNPEIEKYEQQSWNEKMRNPFRFWEIALANCPLAIKILAGICFLYAIINVSTGMTDRNLPVVTFFSGMWMAFYAIILAISYPFRPKEVL